MMKRRSMFNGCSIVRIPPEKLEAESVRPGATSPYQKDKENKTTVRKRKKRRYLPTCFPHPELKEGPPGLLFWIIEIYSGFCTEY